MRGYFPSCSSIFRAAGLPRKEVDPNQVMDYNNSRVLFAV